MEGLIPYVYRVVMQSKNGKQGNMAAGSYMRLAGDSGRFQTSNIQLLQTDYIFSSSSPKASRPAPSVSSPRRRFPSRGVAA